MKLKIALITGGFTGEFEVSIKSAAFVEANLDRDRFDVYTITITQQSWVWVNSSGIKHEINKQDFTLLIGEQAIKFDLAMIILHGSPGEDGRLQGYLDMIGVPYTSCDALTSALTMNKGYTKRVLAGIPDMCQAKSLTLFESDRDEAFDIVSQSLTYPLFVKPNFGGSSIGMSKVDSEDGLQSALDQAYDADNMGAQVLVEEFVSGREFTQGIFRDVDGSLVTLPASEVKTTRNFFDFDAKYLPGLTEEITPAELTTNQKSLADRIIRNIYKTLNARGMIRVDFFLEHKTDRFYFIEVNTVPGQTEQSFIPQQVRAFGLTETEFYSKLIDTALKS